VPGLLVPRDRDVERAVYHTFIIQTSRRDELKKYLADNGIGTAIHYPIPIHLQDAGTYLGYPPESFPVAERQAKEILSLPVFPELTSLDLSYVASHIRTFFGV
jgi:dTDP-4-amino-4,6-dideoxygalactose transaminase